MRDRPGVEDFVFGDDHRSDEPLLPVPKVIAALDFESAGLGSLETESDASTGHERGLGQVKEIRPRGLCIETGEVGPRNTTHRGEPAPDENAAVGLDGDGVDLVIGARVEPGIDLAWLGRDFPVKQEELEYDTQSTDTRPPGRSLHGRTLTGR